VFSVDAERLNQDAPMESDSMQIRAIVEAGAAGTADLAEERLDNKASADHLDARIDRASADLPNTQSESGTSADLERDDLFDSGQNDVPFVADDGGSDGPMGALASCSTLAAHTVSPAAAPVDYTRVPVSAPVGDGISLDIPDFGPGQTLARCGLLDVTESPFLADPLGQRDSTAAITSAVEAARHYQLVAWFPPGVYLVSDTIDCAQGLYRQLGGATVADHLGPCVLRGSRQGARPLIRLKADVAAFADPTNPKPVVRLWARDPQAVDSEQASNSYNQTVTGIDFDLGGNPGAIGVYLRAAQGSGLEDSTINATGAFAGVQGGAGSGGSHVNMTVLGGQIGFDLGDAQPAPTIAGITLIDQSQTALRYSGLETLTAVGIKISVPAGTTGPAIDRSGSGSGPSRGYLSLIDSEIAFATAASSNVAIRTDQAVYLRNVYFSQAATLLNGGSTSLAGNPSGWTTVSEYALALAPPSLAGIPDVGCTGRCCSQTAPGPYQWQTMPYLNGVRGTSNIVSVLGDNAAPPVDLESRHVWDSSFPAIESAEAINVRAAPYSAAGDGIADDTDALQQAINEHDLVFLPKGYYRVSRSIVLRSNSQLIGVAPHLSVLLPSDATGTAFQNVSKPAPVLVTADDASASTVVAFIGVSTISETAGGYALQWRSGADSIFRDVNVDHPSEFGTLANPPLPALQVGRPLVVVTGNGGGKFYRFFQGRSDGVSPDYRHLLIDSTSQSLRLYQCNAEHAKANANIEIRGASNIDIFGLKSEGNYTVLWIHDSTSVAVYGYGGDATAFPLDCTYPAGYSQVTPTLFRVDDSTDVRLANLHDRGFITSSVDSLAGYGYPPDGWAMVVENTAGLESHTSPLDRPVLYRRQ
jgi:hypothetical protein